MQISPRKFAPSLRAALNTSKAKSKLSYGQLAKRPYDILAIPADTGLFHMRKKRLNSRRDFYEFDHAGQEGAEIEIGSAAADFYRRFQRQSRALLLIVRKHPIIKIRCGCNGKMMEAKPALLPRFLIHAWRIAMLLDQFEHHRSGVPETNRDIQCGRIAAIFDPIKFKMLDQKPGSNPKLFGKHGHCGSNIFDDKRNLNDAVERLTKIPKRQGNNFQGRDA